MVNAMPPATSLPGQRRGTTVQEAGWAQRPVWMGMESLAPSTGVRSPYRPASSESLYQLRCCFIKCYILHFFKPTRIHDTSLTSEISFLNIFSVSPLRTERCNPLSCKIRVMNGSLKDISIEIWLDSNMFLSSDTECFSVPLLGPFLAAKHTKVIYCRV